MSLVMLLKPDRPLDRRPRHRPRGRANRKGRGFTPEVHESTSSGRLRSPSEEEVATVLKRLGRGYQVEPDSFKITYTGKRNGRHGDFTPDFKTGRVYIEVSMGYDLGEKLREIEFVGERYGVSVIHITPEVLEAIRLDIRALEQLIEQAEAAQVQRRTKLSVTRTPEEAKKRRETIQDKRPKKAEPPMRVPAGMMLSRQAAQIARTA